MNYSISQDLVNALLQYLATRPYAEVFQAIDALRQLQPLEKAD